jgi:hypothetical protein
MVHLTKEQLLDLAQQLRAIHVRGTTLSIGVNIMHNGEPVALDGLAGSGQVYLQLDMHGHIGNFPVYVQIGRQEQ